MTHCLHGQLQQWGGADQAAFAAQQGRLQHRAVRQRRAASRTHCCAEGGASAQGTFTTVADGALRPDDFGPFVQFFRQASPYIEGHRGRTFVICCPGEVMRSRTVVFCFCVTSSCCLGSQDPLWLRPYLLHWILRL